MELTKKHCVPCEGGVAAFDEGQVQLFLREVSGWTLLKAESRAERITKTFEHDDFKRAMAFVVKMADLAEAEGHHPDFSVHYSRVDVTLWTFAARGLTENDFILAAKIDALRQAEV